MILQRALAVLAALLLVGSVALGTLGPPDLPLGQLLVMVDHDLVGKLQKFLPAWMWVHLAAPLLVRPCWLVPAGLGLIATGLSMTLASRADARASHRRRS